MVVELRQSLGPTSGLLTTVNPSVFKIVLDAGLVEGLPSLGSCFMLMLPSAARNGSAGKKSSIHEAES